MNYILIIREEIVCLLVLLFLMFYHIFYQKMAEGKIKDDYYFKLSLTGILHVIFDMITVYSVNHKDIVSYDLNKWFHLVFYLTGIQFIAQFLGYVIKLTLSYRILRVYKRMMSLPLLVIIALSFLLKIEYIEGRGTFYSFGPLVFVCYGIFIVYCVLCILLGVVRFKEIDKKTRIAVVPVSVFMIVAVMLQAVVPEILITSAVVTVVCIGLFITINNPVEAFAQQAYWDDATGIHNKNGYIRLLDMLSERYKNKKTSIGFLVCDMNGLKLINDKYGHAEGDKLILVAASILQAELVTAYNVYRIGGDEFVAVYHSPNYATVMSEIEKVRERCNNYKDSPVALSIAMGYADSVCKADGFDELFNTADKLMYEDKNNIKKLHPELVR